MDILPQFFAVLLVFSLLGLALWALRGGRLARFALAPRDRNAARSLSHVESLALTPHHRVHLLRFGDRVLLLATHPTGCTSLGDSGLPETRGPKQ